MVDCRNLEVDIGKVVKVRGVVDGLDVDGNGGWPFPDVFPVDTLEEAQSLDIIQVLDPLFMVGSKSVRKNLWKNLWISCF